MHNRKTLITVAAVTALALGGIASMGSVLAATDERKPDSLVSRLAERFNLKESDVQAVFDEEKQARQADRQQKLEERLNKAVEDGKLTSGQKDKLLAKLDELQAEREELRGLSREERKAKLQQKKEELKAWANENDIPEQYLRALGGKGHGWPVHRGGF